MMKGINVDEFLDKFQASDFDVRVTHDARYVDQKCTPDIVCFIADCIVGTSCANKRFTVNDLWDEKYFSENCRVIFGKPSPEDPSARNEYNKVLSQPLKLLAYAHVLEVEKRKRELVFHVADMDMLDFISMRERNAYNFMYSFFMRIARNSGIMRFFEEYKENCSSNAKSARAVIYEKYHRFISGNTPSKSKTDVDRIFHKVFNVFAFHEMLPGSQGRPLSLNDLMYNKVNMRDINRKEKNLTRSEGKKVMVETINERYYINYQVNKAIRMVREKQGTVSEVKDELAMGVATEVHHIFPKSEYPELASYFENLILLTSSQHRQKAHPNSKFQLVDKEYQLICLMAKSKTIEDYIHEHGETFYTKKSFVYVVNTGTHNHLLDENDSFMDIRKYIHNAYNGYQLPQENLSAAIVADGVHH